MPAMYQPATSSEVKKISGPRPGARALSDVVIWHFYNKGVRPGGIYNERPIRGFSSWSTHAAGRGIDFMIPSNAKHVGDELYLRLINASSAIGVGEVIWRDKRWTGQSGEKHYKPTNHYDHVHCSMTIDMASRSNTEELKRWFAHFLFVS